MSDSLPRIPIEFESKTCSCFKPDDNTQGFVFVDRLICQTQVVLPHAEYRGRLACSLPARSVGHARAARLARPAWLAAAARHGDTSDMQICFGQVGPLSCMHGTIQNWQNKNGENKQAWQQRGMDPSMYDVNYDITRTPLQRINQHCEKRVLLQERQLEPIELSSVTQIDMMRPNDDLDQNINGERLQINLWDTVIFKHVYVIVALLRSTNVERVERGVSRKRNYGFWNQSVESIWLSRSVNQYRT